MPQPTEALFCEEEEFFYIHARAKDAANAEQKEVYIYFDGYKLWYTYVIEGLPEDALLVIPIKPLLKNDTRYPQSPARWRYYYLKLKRRLKNVLHLCSLPLFRSRSRGNGTEIS